MRLVLKKELEGAILDVGGGGEGVIGRIYGPRVVAIDNRQEELDEAPGGFEKRLMDARTMAFPPERFDHVTFFYSAMFMSLATLRAAVEESARVLRPGGGLHIWDADIGSGWPEPFTVMLDIDAAGQAVRTTYGVGREEPQSAAAVRDICLRAGLKPRELRQAEGQFYLRFEK